jgi:hypothetical protein
VAPRGLIIFLALRRLKALRISQKARNTNRIATQQIMMNHSAVNLWMLKLNSESVFVFSSNPTPLSCDFTLMPDISDCMYYTLDSTPKSLIEKERFCIVKSMVRFSVMWRILNK